MTKPRVWKPRTQATKANKTAQPSDHIVHNVNRHKLLNLTLNPAKPLHTHPKSKVVYLFSLPRLLHSLCCSLSAVELPSSLPDRDDQRLSQKQTFVCLDRNHAARPCMAVQAVHDLNPVTQL